MESLVNVPVSPFKASLHISFQILSLLCTLRIGPIGSKPLTALDRKLGEQTETHLEWSTVDSGADYLWGLHGLRAMRIRARIGCECDMVHQSAQLVQFG